MARRRKTHVQQELRWHNAAGDLRGRKRESATSRRGKKKLGRPKKPGAKQRHAKRPAFASERVVHVTLRVERELHGLRTRACYRAIREAAVTVLRHEDCRIVQLSIQRTHIHLLVETASSVALSGGMKAFQISAAKHLNAAFSRAGSWWERRGKHAQVVGRRMGAQLHDERRSMLRAQTRTEVRAMLPKRRKGRVFADRYHARFVTSPLQARRELAYVLNNWRKHGEDRKAFARAWKVDPFSTGWGFLGWREHRHAQPDEQGRWPWSRPPTYEPIPVYAAQSWLLREGWKRHGLIGMREVPSVRAGA